MIELTNEIKTIKTILKSQEIPQELFEPQPGQDQKLKEFDIKKIISSIPGERSEDFETKRLNPDIELKSHVYHCHDYFYYFVSRSSCT